MKYGDVLRKFNAQNAAIRLARTNGRSVEQLEESYKMLFWWRLLLKNRSDYDDPRSFEYDDDELKEKFKVFVLRNWPLKWAYVLKREASLNDNTNNLSE